MLRNARTPVEAETSNAYQRTRTCDVGNTVHISTNTHANRLHWFGLLRLRMPRRRADNETTE